MTDDGKAAVRLYLAARRVLEEGMAERARSQLLTPTLAQRFLAKELARFEKEMER